MTHLLQDIIADDGTVLFEALDPEKISFENERLDGNSGFVKAEIEYGGEPILNIRFREKYGYSIGTSGGRNSLKYKKYLAAYYGLRRFFTKEETHLVNLGYYTSEYKDPIIYFGSPNLYGTQKDSVRNMENAIVFFWDYARSHYDKIPQFKSFHDLFMFAITFVVQPEKKEETVSFHNRDLFSNTSTIDLSRYIPPFLAQDELDTLSEFIPNYDVEPFVSGDRDTVVRFLARNHAKLKMKSIHQEVLKIDRELLSQLVLSDYTFSTGGSVSSNIFDLKYHMYLSAEYANAPDFLVDFHRSVAVVQEFFSKNRNVSGDPDFSPEIEFFTFHSRLMKDNSYPSPGSAVESIDYAMFVPIWLRKIIENFDVTPSEVASYLVFLDRSGDWSKSDVNSKYVARRMFKDFDLVDVMEIIDSAIESKALATINSWFKYLDNYESHRGISLDVSLEMLS